LYVRDGRTVVPGIIDRLTFGNQIVVFRPTTPYPLGHRMTVVVTRAVVSQAGESLPGGYEGTFIVDQDGIDDTPPEVIRITPADGATNVPGSSSVEVVFSEPIDATQAVADANGDGCSDALFIEPSAAPGTCIPALVEIHALGTEAMIVPNLP